MHKRFFFRNLMAFLLPVLLAILMLGSTLFSVSSQYVQTQAREIGDSLLHQARASLEFLLEEIDTMDLIFNNHPPFNFRLKRFLVHADAGVSYGDYETVTNATSLLNAIASANQYVYSIYVYYDGGNQYFLDSTSKVANLDFFYDTAWYDSYLAQSPSVPMWLENRDIRVFQDDANPTPVLTIFRRISSYGKFNAGLIVYNLKTAPVNALLHHMEPNPDTHVLVLDSQGQLIFCSNNAISEKIRQAGLVVSPERAYIMVENEQYRLSSLSSEYFGLQYVVLQNAQAMQTLPMTTLKTLSWIVGFSIVLSVIAAIFSARRSSRRLYDIIELMDHASTQRPLPQVQSTPTDLYGYILNNILRSFLEQDRMRSQLAERKYKIQSLSLQALHNQISPHFLYNTLQTIYWHVIGTDGAPSATSEMIVSLTEILKYALYNENSSVTLEEEIQIAQSYLNIQAERFPDRFNVFWDIDLETRTLQITKLILQPLLENCFQHGMDQQTTHIDITIASRLMQNKLYLSITDNGAGVPPERLEEILATLRDTSTQGEQHIGLHNTHNRLRLIFGESYGLSFESQPHEFTKLSLIMPAIHEAFDVQKGWETDIIF